ncbi:MAG: RagB/SusD family nutrient uptake outer membrane protein, partial [Rudanella sp.]|nr:RagB/SusD family nutrient uptake outer membrane protein [Rudanella sp.]
AKVNGVAADYADAVAAVAEVEKSGVALVPNFRDITTKRNSEIILAAYFDRNETGSSHYAINALVVLANSVAATNIADLATANNVTNAQSAYQISPLSRSLFDANPTDKRISSTYIWEIQAGKQSAAWIQKYRGTKYPEDRVPDDDVIVYRLADLYLVAAEAYAAQSNSAKSLEYLNKVRQRAGIPNFTGTEKAKLEREILDERGRELFFENKRWYDLHRAHKSGVINVYEYVPNLKGKTTPLYWPVAQSVLAANPKMTQTQGY